VRTTWKPTTLRSRAVLTDVDGTLVTKEKVLTERALAAVRTLRERGIIFTITSGRPHVRNAHAGGTARPHDAHGRFQRRSSIVLPDLSVLDERTLPEYLLPSLIDMIESHGLHVFLFRSYDWFVKSLEAPRVGREASNIQQQPEVVESFERFLSGVVKWSAVSDDHDRCRGLRGGGPAGVRDASLRRTFAAALLDVTHPMAHKGVVIERPVALHQHPARAHRGDR
jgi:hydroxymethylpyrimidine pyrophosphatase-like HAD family hydrolase